MQYFPFDERDGSIVEDYSTYLRDAGTYDVELDTDGKFGGSAVKFNSIDPMNAAVKFFDGNSPSNKQ